MITTQEPTRRCGGRTAAGGRSHAARPHLRVLARSHGVPKSRIEQVPGLTGLVEVAGRGVAAAAATSLGRRDA
ncbi:hypothetical protein GCM10010266_55940 [Streptomyces griseomycini]|uniref:hypothetical protein n=1 Tax=Streptomyces griseomycini TaxID=66895 RepID=UPI0018739160|nr:hypothetical protein [Streptomyces griseomycini]GGQ25383.1 hypothetical protein GCM10010266_55940 [Streptomyces griseomycini]